MTWRERTREFRRLMSYVRPHRTRLIFGVIALALVGLTESLAVLMISPVTDLVLTPGSSRDARVPLLRLPLHGRTIYLNSFLPPGIKYVASVFGFTLIALALCKAVAQYFGSVEIQYVGQAAVNDLRNQVYEKLVRQPLGFFQEQAMGRLVSGVINDVERARYVLSETLVQGSMQTFTLIFLVLVMLDKNWKMSFASAILVPVVVIPVGKLGKRIRNSVRSSQSRLGDLTQVLQESLGGNRVVKAFGMEPFEIRRFRAAAQRLLRENMRWIRYVYITQPMMDVVSVFVIVAVVLYARNAIRLGEMTLGDFAAFLAAMFMAYQPLKALSNVYQQFEQAHGATSQVFGFLKLQEEIQERPGAQSLMPFSERVEFENVSFAYAPEMPVLRGISLKARAGEVVAIVGSSGAGKTTLANLLPRFYDVVSGAIRFDGVDIRDATLRSLREQIAVVTQETILFHDTVWNNICYGQPELSKDRVIDAATAALAHGFISEMPEGYQTVIGDRGERLSGGQRQRLAIARALLKDSPILVLDEATSALDTESEMLVQKALANLMVNRTVFVIAHRLSTIRRADKIVVLDEGRIAETGTHQELLARGGIYARLYEMQFAEDDATPAASPAGPAVES